VDWQIINYIGGRKMKLKSSKIRPVLVTLLVLMMLVAVNAAAPKAKAKAKAKAKPKPMTISVFIASPGQAPTPDNKIYKLIKKQLGVSMKFEYLVGDRDQKLGIMIASGDYPDVMSGTTRLVDAGVFVPLDNLIKKNAPRLYAHYRPYWNKAKEPKDGHLYIMPSYGRFYRKYSITRPEGPCFWMQRDILAENGYPKVRTLDEYFDLLLKYKEKHPRIDGKPTIGFTILSDGWRAFCLTNAPQHLIGHPNDGGVVVNFKTNKAQIFADKDYAKRYYQKLNQMNAVGLIDKESFVMTYDQYITKLTTGRVLGMFDQRWNFGNADASLKSRGLEERRYAPCPVTYSPDIRDWYMDRTVLNVNCGFGITKKCKKPVRVIKFFDTIMSEKWQKIFGWGIRNQDYQVDAKGKFYRNAEQRKIQDDLMWRLANRAEGLTYDGPKMEGTFKDGNATSPLLQPDEFFASLTPYEQNFFKQYGYKTWSDFYSPAPPNPLCYPAWQINLIDGSPAKIAETKLNQLALKYLPKVILAAPGQFERVWKQYVDAIHKVDVKAYENRINKQLQWRMKNWK
jgi:putative aldouronate transport system substrate-binding protein